MMYVSHVTKLSKNVIKIIFCKHCKLYVHKKCTKLKQSDLKRLIPGEWECNNCSVNYDGNVNNENLTREVNNLNENLNIEDVDFDKFEKMAFDPLRYETTIKESD